MSRVEEAREALENLIEDLEECLGAKESAQQGIDSLKDEIITLHDINDDLEEEIATLENELKTIRLSKEEE